MADKAAVEDFGKMKVTDLKKALKERGLPLTGTKSELLDRLKADVQTEEEDLIIEDIPFFDDKLLDSTTETTATIEDSILDDNVDLSEPEPTPKPVVTPKKAEPVVKEVTSPQ
ncbi:uncharacterized protein LOC123530886 [Mercenaria mercenaria]|uniref:uncharacterized protein LOC123530886 n=1 Tax=Mercenaria mercenaria TaxID=6596 RepID=UPI00234FAF01|nr:uncharacterized protein LOC123530886 [Mercenaria mercenaria]